MNNSNTLSYIFKELVVLIECGYFFKAIQRHYMIYLYMLKSKNKTQFPYYLTMMAVCYHHINDQKFSKDYLREAQRWVEHIPKEKLEYNQQKVDIFLMLARIYSAKNQNEKLESIKEILDKDYDAK